METTGLPDDSRPFKDQVLQQLLQLSEALLRGDYSKRITTDFNEDILTRIADNLNRYSDNVQLNTIGEYNNQQQTVHDFIEVISSFANLDFTRRLPISENGTILDAIATGINILGDELEQSVASKKELEREKNLLKEAKELAERANRAKSRFLATMSHEIRTPLNGMLGLTQIMLSEDISDAHRNYLDIIQTSGKELTQLINDILDFSKIENGNLNLEKTQFNFRKVITANIQPYKRLAEEKGLALSCHLDGSLPEEVIGDPNRISQITTNLIGNAIKFTEQGSIELTFSLLSGTGDEVHIQGVIKDTGIGIPKETQSVIFQSFTQADDTITRKYGGTGLGLSIVKSVLQQMKGDITVQSPIDPVSKRGSAFTFSMKLQLPEQQSQNGSVNGKGREHITFRKPLHILIVDDNKVNLLVARKMVGKFGAQVTTAESGKEAIRMVQSNIPYDLVLMDIQMPELDGYETTMELRRLNYTKPILALSANAYSDDVQTSIDSGMNDHLQKPYTEEQLFEMISKFI